MRFGLSGSVLVLAALLPIEAAALSLECAEYDIRTAFWEYQNDEETYLLVQGEFLDVKPAFPDDLSQADKFQARFSGYRASRRAFDRPFEADVILDFSFVAVFLEDPPSANDIARLASEVSEVKGLNGLIWLVQTEAGYKAREGWCWPLIDTDPASVNPALQCLRGGICPTE
jgi:hypothetical protein